MLKNPTRLIFVEDNPDLRNDIQFQLEASGIHVIAVGCAEEMDIHLASDKYDIALVDIGLPGEDGLSIAHRLRKQFPSMGIIMLTAQGAMETRLQSFDHGADCYLVKPVDLRELVAQVRALYRRMVKSEPVNKENGWLLRSSGRELLTPTREGIELTHMEAIVMSLLAEKAGEHVGRELLINEIAGASSIHFDPHRLEVCVSRLWQKLLDALGRHSNNTSISTLPLKTVRGVGYIFTAPIFIDEA